MVMRLPITSGRRIVMRSLYASTQTNNTIHNENCSSRICNESQYLVVHSECASLNPVANVSTSCVTRAMSFCVVAATLVTNNATDFLASSISAFMSAFVLGRSSSVPFLFSKSCFGLNQVGRIILIWDERRFWAGCHQSLRAAIFSPPKLSTPDENVHVSGLFPCFDGIYYILIQTNNNIFEDHELFVEPQYSRYRQNMEINLICIASVRKFGSVYL